ncbi:MAG: PD-(D/E)XK nuclease family protein [Defluviitaleaceae bacterium]|nr:PD-(D/E)XK nuclease family protein [Defluviitaleaceae bacterium]
MPLTFVLGLPGSGKTTYCIDAITNVANQAESPPLFYIVPEQYSLQAEKLLVARSPNNAIMQAQALSFGRLAYHVFAHTGGAPTKQLNDTGKHMLIRKILQECDLSFYTRTINKPGFIENLAHTITEFAQYNVTPTDLEQRANRFMQESQHLTDADLPIKLKDLGTILRHWKEHVVGQYLVTGETLELLADALTTVGGSASSFLQNGLFWIDGFNGFTPQERRVLGRILVIAKEVTITLTMDNIPDTIQGAYLRPSDFFYATKNTFLNLHSITNNVAASVNAPVFLSHSHRHSNRPGLLALAKLFPKPYKSWDKDIETIAVLPLQDRAAELTKAAEWIRYNVVEEKLWKFKDIAVLCGDLSGYEKLAYNIFKLYGIPLFVDSKMGVLSHPLTELIRAAVAVVAWDWQYEGVFRLLKTGFVKNMSTDEIDKLENYVLARGIKSWRWRTEWRNMDGSMPMEDIRLRVLDMLEPLSKGLKPESEITIADLAHRIYTWLYALGAPETLAFLLNESLEAKDQEQARWHKQIWPRIADIFDKLVEILGNMRISVRVFADILDSGLKSADLGLIPPSLDQVVMGDITRSRYPEIKALWVLGANDGQLPPPIGESSLLTEDERSVLQSTGMDLAPDLPRQLSDSMVALYGALCQPKEVLVLSYSKISSDGKPLRPSPILARINKIFPKLNSDISGLGVDNLTVNNVTSDRQNEELNAENLQEIQPLSSKFTDMLYGDTFYTAASKLEAYVQCPFAYFLTYNLKAKERAIYQVRAMDLGILYHDVLAKSTGDLTANQIWHTANYQDLEHIVHSYAEKALNMEDHVLRSSARNMYILERVKRICTVSLWALCEQYRRGTFSISGIEMDIGKTGGIVIPLDINRELNQKYKQMVVTGRIDRIDVLEEEKAYFKIIDYKSGTMGFSMEEVKAGTQLQLLLYMNTLLKNSINSPIKDVENKPGGVFYFNIDDPILPIDKKLDAEIRDAMLLKQFRMSGLVLADEKNIVGMDKHLLTSGTDSLVIPVSIKKDGGFSKNSSIVTNDEFLGLCQHVEDKVKEIGQQMSSGVITPNAFNKGNNSLCKHCQYSAVCGYK